MKAGLSFGSVSGAVFAFWFFLVFSLLVGALSAAIAERRRKGHEALAGPLGGRTRSILLSFGLSAVIFAAAYRSMMDGFYGMAFDGRVVRLTYILPGRSRQVPRGDVDGIRIDAVAKNRYRLVLLCRDGLELPSALASEAQVFAGQRVLHEFLWPAVPDAK